MNGRGDRKRLPRTPTEKRIVQTRRARGVLVPLLEELLEKPVEVEDEEDIDFMTKLMRSRSREREKGVFSPSSLGSCIRQAYFARTGQKRLRAFSPQTHGYFLDGDFRHYKWQFCLWKLHRAGVIELVAVELRVHSSAGDFAGTLDALVKIDGRLYIVDFKGMNVRDFQRFAQSGTFVKHRIQITGYGSLAKVEDALLIAENKAGPTDRGSPIALHEDHVLIRQHKVEMKKRLRELRRYVDEKIVPPPACVSTRHKEFQECPFSWYCREEVRAIQRQRENAARGHANQSKVAVPSRSGDDRSGRARPRRKKRAS